MEEVVGSNAAAQLDARATTAVAFVEGGIQDPCDDACSICLEQFHDSDPSTVTTCDHEFHLQCILEWCQRSSNCPMCWQQMSLKDAASQELLNGVERERSLRCKMTTKTVRRTFHHPVLGEIKLPDLSPDATEADIQEKILHHLAETLGGRRRIIINQSHNRSSSMGCQGLAVSSPTAADRSEPSRFHLAATHSSAGGGHQDSTNNDDSGDTVAESSHHHHHHRHRHHHHHHHHHENSSDESSSHKSLTFSYSLKKLGESVWKTSQSLKEKLFGRSHSMSETVRKEGNAGGSVGHNNASSHSEHHHTANHGRSYSMFYRKTPEI